MSPIKRKSVLLLRAMALVAGIALVSTACNWRGDEEDGNISISGNIELTKVNIAFKVSGKLIELLIEEGNSVEEGAVLARLDATRLERQRVREEALLRGAESRLEQLKTGIQYQETALESEIALRMAEKKQTEAFLRQLLSGSRRQEIEQASAAVEQARIIMAKAESDWERAQVLISNDDISISQHDQYKALYQGSLAALKQAGERLALVREGPRQEEIQAARAKVERAEASLRLTEAARLELKRKRQELTARRAEIERARAQVSVIDAQLDDTVVSSPISGIVLVKSAEPGEVLAPGTTIATIGDLNHPWLRAYIGEQDLGRVKLGSPVRVRTDSYPGKVYQGRVSFIASEAEFTPKQIQTTEERVKLVYRIKIDLENPDQELKLNMPADATIILNQREWN